MSGIAIVFNLDGAPADRETLGRMVDAMAHRGPDGRGLWTSGPIGIGHVMLRTTPEASEAQPLRDEAAGLTIAMDGRVDNRAELLSALDEKGFPPRGRDDVEIVLRAYQAWGEDAPLRILGDFVFVVWDGPRRRLFCARDICGIRPLFYFNSARALVCGSEIHQLFADPRVPREPDEEVVGDYLNANLAGIEATLYRRVKRLAPAHYLIADANGIAVRRYYDLEPRRAIRYARDDQYGDHFREIFEAAIRCRMRSDTGVAAELSGGLDSSSVVAMTDSMRRRGGPATDAFAVFSIAHTDPGCDEREYASAVAHHCGLGFDFVDPVPIDLEKCLAQVKRYADVPDYVSGASFDGLRAAVVRNGMRVILTGAGGDQWFQGSSLFLCDYAASMRFIELGRLLRSDCRFGRPGAPGYSALAVLMRHVVKPLTPPAIVRAMRAALGRRRYPPYVRSDFARRISLEERFDRAPARPAGMGFAQRSIYESWAAPWLIHALEIDDRSAAFAGVEHRHPFYDRHVIEFAMAIPESQKWRIDRSKFVLRNAMRGLLPELVRERKSKADLTAFVIRTYNALGWRAIFRDMALESAGWVDTAKTIATCGERLADPAADLWPVWTVFAMELWFRTIFGAAADLSSTGVRVAG